MHACICIHIGRHIYTRMYYLYTAFAHTRLMLTRGYIVCEHVFAIRQMEHTHLAHTITQINRLVNEWRLRLRS